MEEVDRTYQFCQKPMDHIVPLNVKHLVSHGSRNVDKGCGVMNKEGDYSGFIFSFFPFYSRGEKI